MTVRRRDYPNDRDALAIVKALQPITHTGHGQDDVFEDWLEICETTLGAIPAHAFTAAPIQTTRPSICQLSNKHLAQTLRR